MDRNELSERGCFLLDQNKDGHKIVALTIIGEIEGHELAGERIKTTKYEHLLPILAKIEDDKEIDGLLLIVNSVGGDCSCGLAAAEMIASLTKPTAALIIGDSHSIGVPLSVAADHTLIAPTATMIIHPVRMSGTIIGAPQTFDYFKLIQDRIVDFITDHTKVGKELLEEMMLHKGIMTRDLGTILVGEETVKRGLCDEVGGIKEALGWLHKKIKNPDVIYF